MDSSAIRAANLEASEETLKVLRGACAVCFDVDSTFCADESIDELAAFLGRGDEVAALTRKAMSGTMDFRTALKNRLEVINPSTANFADFLKQGHKLSPGIPELLKLLKSQGKQVFLVSGGFRQIIHPLAEDVGIPLTHVFANNILFDVEGQYAGFDENEFTCQSGGKPKAVRHIKDTFGCKSIVMVGDGATDLEARLEGAADLFIGYGGVVARENVAAGADWFIMDIQQMIAALQ